MTQTSAPLERIAVVVVAYHSSATIASCVRACLADPHVAEVIVVDNSSDEGTFTAVESLGDNRTRYLANSNNGFAAACNLGAAATDAPWLAFVNPDAVLERPLHELVAQLKESTYAVVGAELTPTGPLASARKLVTPPREFLKALRGSRVYQLKRIDLPEAGPVGQVSGALLVCSRRHFEVLEGFDARFELYYEDVDFCARSGAYGGCLFLSTIWGEHAGGHSSSTVSGAAYRAARISRMRYLRKHFPDGVRAWLLSSALIETVTRSMSRAAEGDSARLRSLQDQWREWRAPGSQTVLP